MSTTSTDEKPCWNPDCVRRIMQGGRDAFALNRIRELLDSDEWGPDDLIAIADVIRGTGRTIRDVGGSD